MELITERYLLQVDRWPKRGRHILAQYDDEAVVVYQAYRPAIGHFAAKHGYFGGPDFSFSRVSWIKPNFLWMMYRSGWGSKPGQEVILAVWLKRSAFDAILAEAVHSTYVPELYGNLTSWKDALKRSSVRLQWDPDHHPSGAKMERRAIQLGLRGPALARYARECICRVEDISEFVREQREHVESREYVGLQTPRELLYPVTDVVVAARLELTPPDR